VLVNAGTSTKTIAIAEGPETAMSIREAHPDLRIYAALGVGNFRKMPTEGVEEVLFCVDNDGIDAGSSKQVLEAATHYAEKGIRVSQVVPGALEGFKKTDFNDVLKAEGMEKVKEYLSKPKKLADAITIEGLEAKIKTQLDLPTTPSESTKALELLKTELAQSIEKKDPLTTLGYVTHIRDNEIFKTYLAQTDPALLREYNKWNAILNGLDYVYNKFVDFLKKDELKAFAYVEEISKNKFVSAYFKEKHSIIGRQYDQFAEKIKSYARSAEEPLQALKDKHQDRFLMNYLERHHPDLSRQIKHAKNRDEIDRG
jgi:hypothetical protein